MISVRVAAVVSFVCVLGASPLTAQDLAKYREYSLESTVAAVVASSGARATDLRTSHERPSLIQELLWRAPYELSGQAPVDPVQDVRFGFYNDKLYRVAVSYDRRRTEGLTNDDVIEALSAAYGVPAPLPAPAEPSGTWVSTSTSSTVVAQWEDASTLATLTQGAYPAEFRLIVLSKALDALAVAAIAEAQRLDTEEAPQRKLDERKKQAADDLAAGEKARKINKPAFRP